MSVRPRIHALEGGKFQLSYTLPYTEKRRRLKYQTYEAALEAQQATELAFSPEVSREYAKTTIAVLMARHLELCPNTRISRNKKVLVPTFLARFGGKNLEDVTKLELERWLADLEAERKISKKTVKTWITNLNHFFDFLVDQGALIVSPLRRICLPPDHRIPSRRPRNALTVDEVKRLLDQAKLFCPRYLYPVLLTLAHTGARRAEVLDLLWKDVFLAEGIMTFRDTKNGSDRTIRIPERVLELFRTLPRRSPYVFTCKDGLPLNGKKLEWMVKKFKRVEPIEKKWCIHSFRHGFAHNFLKAGGQMYQLQAILGHRGIDVTIRTYGKLQAVEIENPSPYKF